MKESEQSTCRTCGYAWKTGAHGGHSCGEHLSVKLVMYREHTRKLEKQLYVEQQENVELAKEIADLRIGLKELEAAYKREAENTKNARQYADQLIEERENIREMLRGQVMGNTELKERLAEQQEQISQLVIGNTQTTIKPTVAAVTIERLNKGVAALKAELQTAKEANDVLHLQQITDKAMIDTLKDQLAQERGTGIPKIKEEQFLNIKMPLWFPIKNGRCAMCGADAIKHNEDHLCRMHRLTPNSTCEICGKQP